MESDVKKQVEILKKKRDRMGKKPLSAEERVQILNEIYDTLLYLWQESAILGSARGTGAIANQLESARLEMDSWGGKSAKAQKIIIEWMRPKTEDGSDDAD